MIKVFHHDFDCYSSTAYFENCVNSYLKKLEDDDNVECYSTEVFFSHLTLVYVISIEYKEYP